MISNLRSQLVLVTLMLAVFTCTSSDSKQSPSNGVARVGNTRGGAVVLSRDERVAVVCNRSANVVTVFALDPKAPADKVILRKKEIELEPGTEPWAAVIGADDDTAYVVSRRKQVVFRILELHGNPNRDDPLKDVPVGSEPTGMAIAPSGARVFVANWGEGTISVITTYDFQSRRSLDLNSVLAATGILGDIPGRPALAHPRALALTDNGDADDSDETLYATEFFSQPGASSPPVVSNSSVSCGDWLKSFVPSCEMACICGTCAPAVAACRGSMTCSPFLSCLIANKCHYEFGRDGAVPDDESPACKSCFGTYFKSPLEDAIGSCASGCIEKCAVGSPAPRADAGPPAGDAGADDADSPAGDAGAREAEAGPPAFPWTDPPDDTTSYDRNRVGVVYPISLGAGTVQGPIFIQPVYTEYRDAPHTILGGEYQAPTACFPNQLYAAATEPGRLYVTSMCASPAGPIGVFKAADGTNNLANFKTVVHPVVFVIDTKTQASAGTFVLTQELEHLYEKDGAGERRFPLIPNDLAIAAQPGDPSHSRVYLTALGADAVFSLDPATDNSPDGPGAVGVPGARFIDLHAKDLRAGQLPIGIAVSKRDDAPFALVVNDFTQNLSVVDLAASKVVAVEFTAEQVAYAKEYFDSPANNGHKLFATGLVSWSLKGEAWLSCEGCHPDGLSDGVTWFFARGPRRTISTAGTYDGKGNRRMMLWTGNIDEVHDIEAIVRTVAGGTGVITWTYAPGATSNDSRILYDGSAIPKGEKADPKPSSHLLNNLNGSLGSIVGDDFCSPDADHCDSTAVRDWNDVDAYLRTVRAPRAPSYLDQDLVRAGEELFVAAHCNACHGGPNFTLSRVFYTPGPENNGALPYAPSASPEFGASLPSILGRLRTATYDVPPGLLGLNPPGKSGSAPLRRWNPGTSDPVKYAYDPATASGDQMNCVLRDVGTFPRQLPGLGNFVGIVPKGAPLTLELRQDMKTLALGETGFNIPSLVGLSVGAPYFHAGNARTLEEAFDQVFEKHHAVATLAPGFLGPSENRASEIAALVSYLLSIDESKDPPKSTRADLGFETDLCARTVAPLR